MVPFTLLRLAFSTVALRANGARVCRRPPAAMLNKPQSEAFSGTYYEKHCDIPDFWTAYKAAKRIAPTRFSLLTFSVSSPRNIFCVVVVLAQICLFHLSVPAATPAQFQNGVVVSQDKIASAAGADILRRGGNAVDAAVATAFALAVTHPAAGNIGGGGFLVFRPARGEPAAYDFREMAPAKAHEKMFLRDGQYDSELHHHSHVSVGVPGTVAGLHLAWREQGTIPWKELVEPSVALARDGFVVSEGLAGSCARPLACSGNIRPRWRSSTKNSTPYDAGDIFKQPELARTLERIANEGPRGFYEGETAALFEKEMQAHGGMITHDNLKDYRPTKRAVVRGLYRGCEIISMPPSSSGGVALIEMLNVLEGFDLRRAGRGSVTNIHLIAKTMRRTFADRAQYSGRSSVQPGHARDATDFKAVRRRIAQNDFA